MFDEQNRKEVATPQMPATSSLPSIRLGQLVAEGTPDPTLFMNDLLFPLNVTSFYQTLWEHQPRYFHRHSDRPDYNDGFIPLDLDEFMGRAVSAKKGLEGRHLQATTDISLVKRSSMPLTKFHPDIPPAIIQEKVFDGYSVVMNWMQYRSRQIGQLAEIMEQTLGYRVNVNMYHTPGGNQAFDLHYDETEVLILQLKGAKSWTVFHPSVLSNRNGEERLESKELLSGRHGKLRPALEVEMQPGDLLFIPRGFPHFAPNYQASRQSTHLTIGPHVYFWQTIEAALHHALLSLKPTTAYTQGATSRVAHRKLKKAAAKEAKRAGKIPALTKKLRGLGGVRVDKVMHCAIRQLANQQQRFRKAALFGNASEPEIQRQDLYDSGLALLCKTRPSLAQVAAAMSKDWERPDALTGLGKVTDLASQLEELALPPEVVLQIFVRLMLLSVL